MPNKTSTARRRFCQALAASSAGAFTAGLIGDVSASNNFIQNKLPAFQVAVNWPEFLARHDMRWDGLPARWEEGALIGNGLLGAMVYGGGEAALRWDIGRTDVTDRPPRHQARLPIGHLALVPRGRVIGGASRLDLWNAEASGLIQTDRGEIRWRTLAHAADNLIIIRLETAGGEADCEWQWQADESHNPRAQFRKERNYGPPNPPPTTERVGDAHVCTQTLLAGGEYATAWREVVSKADDRKVRTLYLSVGYSHPGRGGKQEALAAVRRPRQGDFDRLVRSHRRWWHGYYPASFLSVPDTRLEGFYWIQMYKLASATRRDRPVIDLMGPWFRRTPWPKIWWNLNIQLTYWPVYAANRLELGEPLCRMLDRNLGNLINNAPEEFRHDSAAIGRVTSYDCRSDLYEGEYSRGKEYGNLTWACHNYWLQYRYSMDEELLRRLYPLLRRSVNYYLHLLEEGADGRLHLPVAISPEYPEMAPDTNYDLALLRWGCQTLIDSSARLGIRDALLPKWKGVLERLTDYPTDETGLMIGRGVPLARSHRHFSHLLMIYPLHLMTWEQPGRRALIARSLDHWIGLEGALQGYSYTGASSISACIGRRDDAVKWLTAFLDRRLEPNTMYLESGPVIETPLSAANAVQDILMQSWGGKIRIFPGVPDAWRDVAFHNLRAQGAFLVSAAKRDGRTAFVRITSLAGEPCVVQTDMRQPLALSDGRKVATNLRPDGAIELGLRKGEVATLLPAEAAGPLIIEPVAPDARGLNYFGTKKSQ